MTNLTFDDNWFIKYIDNKELHQVINKISFDIISDRAVRQRKLYPVLVVVLKGASTFSNYLFPLLSNLLPEIEYVRLQSYNGTTSSGEVKEVIGITRDLSGRDVIIIEDIVETGLTIEKLKEYLINEKKVKEVKVCALFNRTSTNKHTPFVDYLGKSLDENDFIVGFGLDYNEQGRYLPHIYKLKK